LLVRACLFSCALVVRASACFVFGFNEHLLAWVADAIVARQLLEEARRELAVKRCLNEKLKCPAAQRLDGIEVSSSVVWATG
jgi:hypothetical protein